MVFGPDGEHLAYAAKRGGKMVVVVDGEPGLEYDDVAGITFSPDGQHIAYGANRGGKMLVVMDDEPGPEYDGVIDNGPAFTSSDTVEYLAIESGVLYHVMDRVAR